MYYTFGSRCVSGKLICGDTVELKITSTDLALFDIQQMDFRELNKIFLDNRGGYMWGAWGSVVSASSNKPLLFITVTYTFASEINDTSRF